MNIRPITWLSTIVISCAALFGCEDMIIVEADSNPDPISNVTPILKVYIENSGSMDGYMCDGSQLKDALFDYVSDLNVYSDTTQLYYINSQIIPYTQSLEQYVKTMNPAIFHELGGNRFNSDLSNMLSSILKEMTDSTVSIFVSDCILDLPVSNAQKFLNTCQISIKNAVNESRTRIPNLGVEVIKMTSDFNGKYFYQNGGIEYLKDVKRPYYIWIFGNNNILAKLNSKVSLTGLEKHGFENIVSYSKEVAEPYDIKNRALTGTTIKSIGGDYKATIRVDFRSTLQPETVIQDPSNYMFETPSLTIEEIGLITATGSQYTHFINIVIPKGAPIVQDHLKLKAPKMQAWVSESNDESGEDIKNNLNKTTGIKYLVEGVADAYKKDNILTTLKFTIKRK